MQRKCQCFFASYLASPGPSESNPSPWHWILKRAAICGVLRGPAAGPQFEVYCESTQGGTLNTSDTVSVLSLACEAAKEASLRDGRWHHRISTGPGWRRNWDTLTDRTLEEKASTDGWRYVGASSSRSFVSLGPPALTMRPALHWWERLVVPYLSIP